GPARCACYVVGRGPFLPPLITGTPGGGWGRSPLSGGQGDRSGGPRGRWHSEVVRGLEEHLLQRAGQIAAPDQGRRRGQRVIAEADLDHAGGIGQPGAPVRRRPAARRGGGAGQDRGGPVRRGGAGERQGQRAMERGGGGIGRRG